MGNRIIVDSPIVEQNRITYKYKVEGEWEKVFADSKSFQVEYSIDISNIPEGIAVIPLLANILPMSWVYDAEIVIPACDEDFYYSIPEFKKGYEQMYPMMKFLGKVKCEKLEKNAVSENDKVACFFSGGVDAFGTLVSHAEEHPILITLWGADVKLNDLQGWKNVENHLKITAEKFNTSYVTVRSEFRTFFSEVKTTEKVKISGDGWWHGFQHGVGIISHAAPIVYVLGIKKVYFASSFTVADKGKVTCASDPTIDNYVRFSSTEIIHDGYEFTRQMKVHNIVEYAKKNGVEIPLRVCWESTGGSNCCKCEKCWRTILAIYAENQDPRKYGFNYTDEQLKHLAKTMKHCGNKMIGALRYEPIQKAMQSNCQKKELPKAIRWFYDAKIEHLGEVFLWKKILRKVKRILVRVLK